jgi:hypothetical protein
MSSQNNTAEIIANFTSNVDINKSYTLKELLSILTKAYPRDKKKREPSSYNIYMKEKMSEIKKNNPEMVNKDVMNMAAKEWGINKNNITQSLVKEQNVITKEEIEVVEEKKATKKKSKKIVE